MKKYLLVIFVVALLITLTTPMFAIVTKAQNNTIAVREDEGFNLWWILPLLLLPIILLYFTKDETNKRTGSEIAYHDIGKDDEEDDLEKTEDAKKDQKILKGKKK